MLAIAMDISHSVLVIAHGQIVLQALPWTNCAVRSGWRCKAVRKV